MEQILAERELRDRGTMQSELRPDAKRKTHGGEAFFGFRPELEKKIAEDRRLEQMRRDFMFKVKTSLESRDSTSGHDHFHPFNSDLVDGILKLSWDAFAADERRLWEAERRNDLLQRRLSESNKAYLQEISALRDLARPGRVDGDGAGKAAAGNPVPPETGGVLDGRSEPTTAGAAPSNQQSTAPSASTSTAGAGGGPSTTTSSAGIVHHPATSSTAGGHSAADDIPEIAANISFYEPLKFLDEETRELVVMIVQEQLKVTKNEQNFELEWKERQEKLETFKKVRFETAQEDLQRRADEADALRKKVMDLETALEIEKKRAGDLLERATQRMAQSERDLFKKFEFMQSEKETREINNRFMLAETQRMKDKLEDLEEEKKQVGGESAVCGRGGTARDCSTNKEFDVRTLNSGWVGRTHPS